MEYNQLFTHIDREIGTLKNKGEIATYIPELGHVNPDKFGIYLCSVNKQAYNFGDWNEKFSIQSIAKVLALTLAYKLEGENLWKRVGVEPSGDSFNALAQLEKNKGVPRNPLINAGALVISDILISHFENPKKEFIHFVRSLSGNQKLDYCARITASEKETGYKNAAMVNLMKSFGNIKNDIDVVLDFYFNLCSIEMTCKELAETFLFLANYGKNPFTNKPVINVSKSKRLNAIMQLCGFYDEAGEFSFKVGLPGKSGVGGGIVAVLPNKYCITLWSPRLNKKGNSARGMAFLERFTSETETSIF
ncbi:MAG: glutaminase [Flavobacteriaceae bacterium]